MGGPYQSSPGLVIPAIDLTAIDLKVTSPMSTQPLGRLKAFNPGAIERTERITDRGRIVETGNCGYDEWCRRVPIGFLKSRAARSTESRPFRYRYWPRREPDNTKIACRAPYGSNSGLPLTKRKRLRIITRLKQPV